MDTRAVTEIEGAGERWLAGILAGLLLVVPLVPNPGLFTNSDDPKWIVLAAGVAVCLLIVLYRALSSRQPARLLIPEHLAILLVLVVAALISGKTAPDGRTTTRILAEMGLVTVVGLLASRYLATSKWTRAAFYAALLAGAVSGLLALTGIDNGAATTYGNPSFAAEFCAGTVVLGLALFLEGRRWFAGIAGALALALLVLAKSRADWLGLAAALAVLGLLELTKGLRRRPPAWVVGAALLVAITALPFVIDSVPIPRLGRSDTVKIRRLIRRSTIEMGLDHPVAGVGIGGFAAYYPKYRSPEESKLSLHRQVTFPHNLPAQVFAETGAFGLFALTLFLLIPLASGVSAVYENPGDLLAFGAFGGLVAILVSAQFSAPLRHPASSILFFVLSAICVARRPRRVVTSLPGRYRRALPVLVMAVPVVVLAVRLPPHIRSDVHLARAHDLERAQHGGMNEETAEQLELSRSAEWNPAALRELALYRTDSGKPQEALAVLDDLFSIRPYDVAGRIEKARALLRLKEPKKAEKILDGVLLDEPGYGIPRFLRGQARIAQRDVSGGLADFIRVLETEPAGAAGKDAAWIKAHDPDLVPAVTRMAERVGGKDLPRGLAILEGLGRGEPDYYRAILLAEHGKLDAAMDALRAAAREGVAGKVRLENDPRLAPLRGRADFQALSRSEK